MIQLVLSGTPKSLYKALSIEGQKESEDGKKIFNKYV